MSETLSIQRFIAIHLQKCRMESDQSPEIYSHRRLPKFNDSIADKHSITYTRKANQNCGRDDEEKRKELCFEQERSGIQEFHNNSSSSSSNSNKCLATDGSDQRIRPRPIPKEEKPRKDIFFEQKRSETMGPLNKAIMAMAYPECKMMGSGYFAKKLLELEIDKEQHCKVDCKRSPELIKSEEQNLKLECPLIGSKKFFETDLDLGHRMMRTKSKGHKRVSSKFTSYPEYSAKKLPELEGPRKQNHEGGYKRLPESKQFMEQKLKLKCLVHGCKKRFETYLDLEHHILHTAGKSHEKAYVRFVKKICHPEYFRKKLPKPEKNEERDSKLEFKGLQWKYKLKCPVNGCERCFESELDLEHHLLHTKGKAHEKAYVKFVRKICQGVSKEPELPHARPMEQPFQTPNTDFFATTKIFNLDYSIGSFVASTDGIA